MGNRALVSLLVLAAACSGGGNTPDAGTDATTADVTADAPSTEAGTDASDASDASADAPADVVEAACTVDGGTTYLMDAVEVSGGADCVCALRQDGTAACWGNLGGSTPKTVVFPADAGVVKLTHIAVQAATACAIDTTGLVWCWGAGGDGNLGNGTTTAYTATPVVVVDGTSAPIHAVDLGTGYNHMCALTAAGSVLCWGDDNYAELGQDAGVDDAGHSRSTVALQVPGLTLSSLAKGGAGDFSAGFSTTTVACWGGSSSGECGVAAATALNASVGSVFTSAGATLPLRLLSHGLYHVCALDSANHVYCMGEDSADQCGSNGATGPTAHLVPELDAGVTDLSCGYDETCVVDSAQHALCFGTNGTYGWLGVGNLNPLKTGVPQTVVDIDGGPALFPVSRVIAGGDQMCAILGGACGANGPGQVVCWGYGGSGNLGNGGTAASGTPVQVLAPH